VSTRVADLAAAETGGHAEAAQFWRTVRAAVFENNDRYDGHDGGRLRRSVRRDSTVPSHGTGPRRSPAAAAHRDRANREPRAVVSGDRRPGGTGAACLPRCPNREPPAAAASLSDTRSADGAVRLRRRGNEQPYAAEVGHLLLRDRDDRAVQLLGELSAARVPD